MTHKRDISSIFQCLQPEVSHSDPPSDYYVHTLPSRMFHALSLHEQTGLDAQGFVKQEEKGFNMETTHHPVCS